MQYPGERAIGARVPRTVGVRAQQPAVLAPLAVGLEVVAERQRRQRVVAFPRGAEGDGPGVAAVDAERLVGALEPAVAEPAQHDVLADPQHDEIGVAVSVDVERIAAGDGGQIGHRGWELREPQRAAELTVVVVQRSRFAAAGEEQVAAPIVVAVEGGDTAADEVLEVAGVAMVDGAGLLDEPRRGERRSGAVLAAARAVVHHRQHDSEDEVAGPPHVRIEPHPAPAVARRCGASDCRARPRPCRCRRSEPDLGEGGVA